MADPHKETQSGVNYTQNSKVHSVSDLENATCRDQQLQEPAELAVSNCLTHIVAPRLSSAVCPHCDHVAATGTSTHSCTGDLAVASFNLAFLSHRQRNHRDLCEPPIAPT
jgi:hypothetical protein